MNLIVIAAVVAVCGAAKLDRTYLPPASAKSAGGSPGSLQTPFAGNSFNQGLGGLPKGSFTNDFQGVVVDAAAAGTRAAGPDDSGLGAPRSSYGSMNSKVGDAAFNAGFRNQGFDDHSHEAQDFHGFESKSERPQAALERTSNTVRFHNEVGPEAFSYAFETDNGISAEENGVAVNGVQAQGGFSYTGDDGQVYSVTYTADEGGYQPRGDHLPTPPPIPEEILKSLEQNAKEEAAGLIDDGSYDAQKYNAGDDYTESNSANDRQSAKFGNRPGSDANAGNYNQNNHPFSRPDGLQGSFRNNNAHVEHNNGFRVQSNDAHRDEANKASSNRFGSRNNYLPPVNGFNRKKIRPQNVVQNTDNFNYYQPHESESNNNNFQQNEDKTLVHQEHKTNAPFSSKQNLNKPQFSFTSSHNNDNNYNQREQNNELNRNTFGSRKEYLPPNTFQFKTRPSAIGRPRVSDANRNINTNSQNTQNTFPVSSSRYQGRPNSGASSSAFASVGPAKHISESEKLNSGEQQQTNFNINANSHFPSLQRQSNIPQNGHHHRRPTTGTSLGFTSFDSQRATSQPDTELTTPFESNDRPEPQSSNIEHSDHDTSNLLNSQPIQSQFGFHSNNAQSSQVSPSRAHGFKAQATADSFNGNNAHEYNVNANGIGNQDTEHENKFNQVGQFGNKQVQLSPNRPNNGQFSSGTRTSSFNEPHSTDESYYYNQPAKKFGSPSTSRFSSIPSNQFNIKTQPQVSSQGNGQLFGTRQQNFPSNAFQNVREHVPANYPGQSDLSPAIPTLASQSQATTSSSKYNGITQATVSAFTSGSPTPTTQFNPQFVPLSPTPQTSAQSSNQKLSPSSPSFVSHPTRTSQTLNRQENQNELEDIVSNQQYNGEVYEYNKPAETLPSPQNKETSNSRFESSKIQQSTSQPNLSSDRDSTQYSENTLNQQKPTQELKYQYSNSRPQFGETLPTQESHFGTQDNAQHKHSPVIQGNKRFGTQSPQINQAGGQVSASIEPQHFGHQNREPLKSVCCQRGNTQPQFGQSPQITASKHGFQNPTQSSVVGKFGDSTFQGASGSNTDALSQVLSGRGEEFGGPRKPPSFDENGYHY